MLRAPALERRYDGREPFFLVRAEDDASAPCASSSRERIAPTSVSGVAEIFATRPRYGDSANGEGPHADV